MLISLLFHWQHQTIANRRNIISIICIYYQISKYALVTLQSKLSLVHIFFCLRCVVAGSAYEMIWTRIASYTRPNHFICTSSCNATQAKSRPGATAEKVVGSLIVIIMCAKKQNSWNLTSSVLD